MRKVFCILFAVLVLSSVCFAADFDGYIVKIADNTASRLFDTNSVFSGVSLFGELDDSDVVDIIVDEFSDVSEINSKHMLVKAEDETTLQMLIDLGIVESYEENVYLELFDYDVTANPNYENQKWYLDYINADYAWNAGVFGNDVIVAVIDSGVCAHNDIKKNLLPGKNFYEVENYGESYTDDNSDHGTRVAGIIAAECNSLSTVGVSFKSKILPLKVTDGKELTMDRVVAAIYYAVKSGCDVINLSLGGKSGSAELKAAVDYAISNNVIVVAAAGNTALSGNEPMYPASFDEVVSVANAMMNGTQLTINESSQKNTFIDIAAPGTKLHTLTNSNSVDNNKSGTSFSCPVISAVAALAKSVKPDLAQSQFEDLLKASANSSYIAASGLDSTAWGAGFVDIKTFLQYLLADDKYYLSENISVNDEVSAYITNLSDSSAINNCTIIVSERDLDGALNVEYLNYSIAPSTSVEISLSKLGFSADASLRVVLDRIPGDVNGDGTVGVRDASVILRYLAGYNVVADVSMMDVNGDDNISVRDASAILRFCAGYNVDLH